MKIRSKGDKAENANGSYPHQPEDVLVQHPSVLIMMSSCTDAAPPSHFELTLKQERHTSQQHAFPIRANGKLANLQLQHTYAMKQVLGNIW